MYEILIFAAGFGVGFAVLALIGWWVDETQPRQDRRGIGSHIHPRR